MRRGALRAGFWAALVVSGCAPMRPGGSFGSRPKDEAATRITIRCQELSEAAQAAIDRHDGTAAVSRLRELVALEPKSAEAHHRLGTVYQSEGRLAEAEASYKRALGLDNEYVAALIGLGSIDAALVRHQAALERFDAAIEIDPRQGEAHLGRGRALEALGKTDEALASYFRALEFTPNSSDARLRVATLQLARDEPDQALARLDALVEPNPDDAEARFQRGRAHLALGHVSPALSDLKAAADKLPERPDVLLNLAFALAADHEPKAALAASDRALQLAPHYAEAQALARKLRR